MLFKKIICTVMFIFLLSLNVLAGTDVNISVGKDYTVYRDGENTAKIASTVGMSADEFKDYCDKNSIIYFAATKDNSAQIKISAGTTSFSSSIVNLSLLGDDKITSLLPDITGSPDIRGEIVNNKGQKFVKTYISTSDSGGEYTVTQYITVANRKEYVLSLYAPGAESEFDEKIFESFTADDFIKEEPSKSYYKYIILGAIALLIIGSVYIIFTIVRDIKNSPKDEI